MANPKNVEGMARFGINPKYALGISVTNLRKIAKRIDKNHQLSLELWSSNIHEARILASMIGEPSKVTKKQMDTWITEFNSWDLCDQVNMNLFDKTPFAFNKAVEWTKRKPEFEKRAGFSLMACLAWHDKVSPDIKFIKFFPYIKRGAIDERNFVIKSVNWALRQIGKRNKNLNKKAIKVAGEIEKLENKSAKWVARGVLRELVSEKVVNKLR